MTAIGADSTKVKPLTKKTEGGAVYTRRADAELQIEKIITLDPSQILAMLGAGKERGDADYLLDETLVYLLREARRTNDEELLNELYMEMNKRIWRKIGRFRTNFVQQSDFEDFGQKTEMAILRKILNVESDAGDFAQVQFGSFILSEAKSAWKQNLVQIKKDQEFIEAPREDEEDENALENLSLPDNYNAENRLIYEEKMRQLSPEQQIIAAMLIDGFQIESKHPDEMTISKHLNVTSRTIRNRIKEIRAILTASQGEGK